MASRVAERTHDVRKGSPPQGARGPAARGGVRFHTRGPAFEAPGRVPRARDGRRWTARVETQRRDVVSRGGGAEASWDRGGGEGARHVGALERAERACRVAAQRLDGG